MSETEYFLITEKNAPSSAASWLAARWESTLKKQGINPVGFKAHLASRIDDCFFNNPRTKKLEIGVKSKIVKAAANAVNFNLAELTDIQQAGHLQVSKDSVEWHVDGQEIGIW